MCERNSYLHHIQSHARLFAESFAYAFCSRGASQNSASNVSASSESGKGVSAGHALFILVPACVPQSASPALAMWSFYSNRSDGGAIDS